MCFLQAVDNGVAEALELGIIFGIKALFFDKFPKALNQIQIGRIRRQEKQFDLKSCRKLLDDFSSLIARIIQNQCHRRCKVEVRNLPEKIADTLAVDIGVIDNREQFMSYGIQSSQDIEALSAGGSFQKESHGAPKIS